ncbi:MAG TPA: S46 family peptidase [Gemmataceae bacterium]|nr:S46 family peptidase [Gemmataceae bacterium]
MKRFLCLLPLALVIIMMQSNDIRSDEGLWLFNNPPKEHLKKKYNFDAPQTWYDHLQRSSVRFNTGGSGSFVSADGLVMTNHHVGLTALQRLTGVTNKNIKDPSKKVDYAQDGFYARTLEEEFKSVDEELNVLVEITDVTARVKGAVTKEMTPEQAFEARRGVIAKIEAEATQGKEYRGDVVTLYQGGQYHLYKYKRYTDVRLVMAPEQRIAFFGGDPANFAYPRYDLDMCFFRVYENGKPAKIEHYLKWSKDGVSDNELVFVSGHPGHTDRLNTVADLEYNRDVRYPNALQRLMRLEVLYSIYSMRSADHERKAKDAYFGVANSRKAYYWGQQGLQDAQIMNKKKKQEKAILDALAKNPDLKDLASAWKTVAEIQKIRAANAKRYNMLEGAQGFNSPLFGYARTIVRGAEELTKPNEKRLAEFGDAGQETLKIKLYSPRTFDKDFEVTKLSDSLSFLCEILGYKDPLVQKVLAGKSPSVRAFELIDGSKMQDPKFRKELYEGGKAAVDASKDPLIQLAKLVDPEARKVRKILESKYAEPNEQAYDKIAQAKFAIEGASTYPDATFTLRLSFGPVKGYVEDGKKIPYQTTFEGLYETVERDKNRPPFDVPQRWLDKKAKLNLKTPFNFVCTADIIGGNSGSPVVNRAGEVVGLIFDGNIQSLVWDFVYTEEQARAVAVCSQAIPEALRAIYDASDLANEIVSGQRK